MGLAIEKSPSLDSKQKAVEEKIMDEILSVFFLNLEHNKDLFDAQSVIDVTISILIMFNRDVLTHLISCFHLEAERKDLMKRLFEKIRDQVNDIIRKGMM